MAAVRSAVLSTLGSAVLSTFTGTFGHARLVTAVARAILTRAFLADAFRALWVVPRFQGDGHRLHDRGHCRWNSVFVRAGRAVAALAGLAVA